MLTLKIGTQKERQKLDVIEIRCIKMTSEKTWIVECKTNIGCDVRRKLRTKRFKMRNTKKRTSRVQGKTVGVREAKV